MIQKKIKRYYMAKNTGKKDAKGRSIYEGARGGLYVLTSAGKKTRPAKGRLTKKALEDKAKQLSATRRALSAKRQNLESRERKLYGKTADNVMRRLNVLRNRKAADVRRLSEPVAWA